MNIPKKWYQNRQSVGKTVSLIHTVESSLRDRRSGYIKIGTKGVITASQGTGCYVQYLVKFKSHGGLRYCEHSWIKLED
jgi:hypothetical protein